MTASRRQYLRRELVTRWRWELAAVAVAAVVVLMLAACAGEATGVAASGEPWGTNTVTPADLVTELEAGAGAGKPVIVCTAPAFMYRLGHIPGAVLHGPASDRDGLNDLMIWARTLPKTTSLVVYCGCCPLAHCPNLRPAYTALASLGFARLRVLILPDNFGTDWADRGYPIEK